MALIREMFQVRFLLLSLLCLGFGAGLVDPGRPDVPQGYRSVASGRSLLKIPPYVMQEPVGRPGARVRTVSVVCYPAYMEVRVKADLFDLGMPVDPADLRMGTEDQSCGVTATSDEEYVLQSPLTDCNTRHWVTDESLIYTNVLVYSPTPSLDGLVRTEGVTVPVECHYRRKFDVDSDPVLPTWIPHLTTKSVQENLHFTLRLMTGDWQNERGSAVYFLGDMINMEAAVFTPRLELRVFISRCVATTTPSSESVLRYDFVEKNGCLVDGQLTGSSSHFLPRDRPDRLRLQLKAFVFHQVKPAPIYISCTLKAYPLQYASETMSKACSFTSGRWRSAEGDDWTCSSCENQYQSLQPGPLGRGQAVPTYRPKANSTEPLRTARKPVHLGPPVLVGKGISTRTLQEPASAWRSSGGSQRRRSGSVAVEQEASLGPLSVFPWRSKLEVMVPPRTKEDLPLPRGPRPIPHHNLWRSEHQPHAAGGEEPRTDLQDAGSKDVWKKQRSAGEGTPAPEADVLGTAVFTTSAPHHTAPWNTESFSVGGDSVPVSTARSDDSTASVNSPVDGGSSAQEQEQSAGAWSPAQQSDSSTLNNETEVDASTDDPGSLRKGPV